MSKNIELGGVFTGKRASGNVARRVAAAIGKTDLFETLESRRLLSVSIVAQSNTAFYNNPVFATAGAAKVAGYTGAAQNGSFTGISYAGLNKSIGQAFTLASATTLTDFELNETGGPSTPAGGHVNFTVAFGTLNTSSGVFTQSSIQNATAIGSATVNNGQPANTFEDFQLSSPIQVAASAAGSEYAFIIGENQTQDQADDSGAALNQYNTTYQAYAGGTTGTGGIETINNGVATPGTSLNFVVGGTTSTQTIPSAPTNLTAAGGNAQVALTWTPSSGAASYNIKRSTTNGSGYTLAGTSTTASFTDTGRSNGTTYYYVVTAVNGAGESGSSNQASATPQLAAPAAPTNLSAMAGNAQVGLAWNASSGATSYSVRRSTTSGSGYSEVGTTSGTTYTDTSSVANGTTYYYVIVASNSGGSSGNSNQASATPQGTAGQATIVAQGPNGFYGQPTFATAGATQIAGYVGAPQNGTFSGMSKAALNSSIGVGFSITTAATLTDFELNETGGPSTPAGGHVNFTLTFGTLNSASGAFSAISSQNATAVSTATVKNGQPANTFEDFQLATPIQVGVPVAGTEYAFIISENSAQDQADDGGATLTNNNTTYQAYSGAATNVAGIESINNGSGTAGTVLNFLVGGTSGAVTVPGAPTNVAATAGNAQVSLTWTGSSGATNYNVLRSTTSGSGYTQVGTTSGTTYSDTSGLSNGTTYYYVVVASNSAGSSGNSNQATATPTSGGGGRNLGNVMFLGDSITVGAHGTNAGYRGYIIQDLLGVGDSLTTVGSQSGDSPYLDGLPNSGNYVRHEGHSGSKILDLYDATPGQYSTPYDPNDQYYHTTQYGDVAATTYKPTIIYLMIGSNDRMGATPYGTAAQYQAAQLQNELALIARLKADDANLQRIYVEPPPSYPTDPDYSSYSTQLGNALLGSPYSSYTTFVSSRGHLTTSNFYHDANEVGDLHPNDSGYQIIANDLFNASK